MTLELESKSNLPPLSESELQELLVNDPYLLTRPDLAGKIPDDFPIFAIAGAAYSGKDTVANFVIDYMNRLPRITLSSVPHADCLRGRFAFSLKKMIHAGFGIDIDNQFWIDRKEVVIESLGKTVRYMMQTLGTEWGRELIHENLWVLMTELRTQHARRVDGIEYLILPDYRFPNEGLFLEKYRAFVIHLERPDSKKPDNSGHMSETKMEVKDREYKIINDGTLDDLRLKVWAALDDYFNYYRDRFTNYLLPAVAPVSDKLKVALQEHAKNRTHDPETDKSTILWEPRVPKSARGEIAPVFSIDEIGFYSREELDKLRDVLSSDNKE